MKDGDFGLSKTRGISWDFLGKQIFLTMGYVDGI
jgi:hypothetical protein